jgi:PiT family inorganic phosphate transporter
MHRLEERYFRYGQVGSASLVSIAHGTNDAQKTMGVMTLALIASGHWTSTDLHPRSGCKFSAATAIAAGTYLGGWRIIRTLGKGLVDITPRQGMSSDGPTAAVLLSASHLGFALSTTHVATGSVLGGRPRPRHAGALVDRGRMVTAWATTFPIAALMGALMWWIGDSIGGRSAPRGVPDPRRSRPGSSAARAAEHVGAHNVNDTWERAARSPRRPTSTPRPREHPADADPGPRCRPRSTSTPRPAPTETKTH